MFQLIMQNLKSKKNFPLASVSTISAGKGGVVKPWPAPIISIPPAISPAAIPSPKVQIAK